MPIGAVFTPEPWAAWLLRRYGLVERWLGGCSVLDPTCGDGQFLSSMIDAAVRSGHSPDGLPLHRLFGIEREKGSIGLIRRRLRREFGVVLPRNNLLHADILLDRPRVTADLIVGNPPWQNFADLPPAYKELLKPLFVAYGLAGERRKLLLGHSRIDLAALVIAKVMAAHVAPGGEAFFFIPLSLLLNEGAHAEFRKFRPGGVECALAEFVDLEGAGAFPGVSTRYGAARFRRDARQHYPVACHRLESGVWKRRWAAPVGARGGALSICRSRAEFRRFEKLNVLLPEGGQPRQGVNTCGANGVLIFSRVAPARGGRVTASSALFGEVTLPSRFLFPLLDPGAFELRAEPPGRFILLPYDAESGRPLEPGAIGRYPELSAYLARAEKTLRARRGSLIAGWIRRGYWWASLGVGRYSFAPYKVAWMSYGRSLFEPRIFRSFRGASWQGNQALHAYVPCRTRNEAKAVLRSLSRPEVSEYLESFRMGGTRSWAQPGRILRLCSFEGKGAPA